MEKRYVAPYGLLPLDAIKEFTSETVLSGIPDHFVVTSDLANAKNHCATTAITNLALYFHHIGKSSAVKKTPEETLRAVYEMVGNGPILFFRRRAKGYFRMHDEKITMKAISREEVSEALKRGHISVLLLRDGLFHWHWALAIGECIDASGRRYFMVMDAWNRGRPRYLNAHNRRNLVYALECKMEMF